MEGKGRAVVTITPELVHHTGAELGEGPFWWTPRGALVWVDLHAGVVHRLAIESGSHERWHVNQPVSAVVRRHGGGFLLALRDGIAEAETFGATPRLVEPINPGQPQLRCNDASCDSRGRLWVGTMADDCSPGEGAVYRYTQPGALKQMIAGATIANGTAWSPQDDTMYFIDSAHRSIDRFSWEPEEGAIGRRSVFIRTSDCPGIPDGMAVDADGCLWVAFFGGGAVRRFTPAGQLDTIVTLPVTQVTSCAFGGKSRDALFITTARRGLNPEQRREQPLAGDLFACPVSTPGMAVYSFGGSQTWPAQRPEPVA